MRRAVCARFTLINTSLLFLQRACILPVSRAIVRHCKLPLMTGPQQVGARHGASTGTATTPRWRHSFCSALADAPKSIHPHVYGHARALFDSSERYLRLKATRKMAPHGVSARNCWHGDHFSVPPSRRGSPEHDSMISFATLADPRRSTQARRGRARGSSSREIAVGSWQTPSGLARRRKAKSRL